MTISFVMVRDEFCLLQLVRGCRTRRISEIGSGFGVWRVDLEKDFCSPGFFIGRLDVWVEGIWSLVWRFYVCFRELAGFKSFFFQCWYRDLKAIVVL